MIRDLGSHNGLRVNGRLVEEARLHPGDEVAIGPLIYRLEIEAAPQRLAGPTGARPPGADRAEPGQAARQGAISPDSTTCDLVRSRLRVPDL